MCPIYQTEVSNGVLFLVELESTCCVVIFISVFLMHRGMLLLQIYALCDVVFADHRGMFLLQMHCGMLLSLQMHCGLGCFCVVGQQQ